MWRGEEVKVEKAEGEVERFGDNGYRQSQCGSYSALCTLHSSLYTLALTLCITLQIALPGLNCII